MQLLSWEGRALLQEVMSGFWKGEGYDIFRLQTASGSAGDRSIFRCILCHPRKTQKVTKHQVGFLVGKVVRAGVILSVLSHAV